MSRKLGSARRRSIPLHPSVSAVVREFFAEIEERNLSISELARRAGVSRELVYRWTRGHSPRLSDLEAMLELLGRALYTKDSDYERRVVDADLRAYRDPNPVAKRVREVKDAMPDEEFLRYMTACAQDGVFVSAAQVNRLKKLAQFAETPHPPAGWWGPINETETAKAVGRARAFLAKGQVRC